MISPHKLTASLALALGVALTPLAHANLQASLLGHYEESCGGEESCSEIAASKDSKTAWVSLQENNALAIIDIQNARVKAIKALGFKDHTQAYNAFDASNKDEGINIQTWPTKGMYQPDAIASLEYGKTTFILSANEGDARDYDGYSEEVRVKDLELDPTAFPDASTLQRSENLGRLKTTTANGDTDKDGDFDEIYSYGARSFSVWNEHGQQVWDSGSAFEEMLAKYASQGSDVWEDGRSDDKGPEPESITTGKIGHSTYAFIGLERTSGFFIYDVSNPYQPTPAGFVDTEGAAGDVGPEGILFIPKSHRSGWLVLTNEISNSISVYHIQQ